MALTHRTLVVALVLAVSGGIGAQTKNACALLTITDLQPVAGATHIKDGVAEKPDPIGIVTCRYEWGTGANAVAGKYTLDVAIGDQAKMWAGTSLATIKQGLLAQVNPKAPNTVAIAGVGDASIFQSDGLIEAHTTTLIKGQVLTIALQGPDAQKKKDGLIALTKLAASRM